MNDDLDLFSKIEQEKTEIQKSSTSKKKKGRKATENPLKYEEKDDDPELVRIVKDLINEDNITNQNVYDIFGRSEGWNMIYSLKKSQMSWERFKKWMEVLNLEVNIDIKERTEQEKDK